MGSIGRYITVSAAATLVSAGALAGLGAPANASAAPAYPAHLAAPYLQLSNPTSEQMPDDMGAPGLKDYTLAFLASQSKGPLDWEAGNEAMGAFEPAVKT